MLDRIFYMNKAHIISSFLLVFFTISYQCKATNYYVNDNSTSGDRWCSAVGNDVNNGTAVGTPKLTLYDIMDDYDLGAGYIVYIDHGSYTWAT
ncbi:MAG: hypothetical protein NT150_01330, partial [Bacteroidetes bacterium]|nr:hypothetical protein [Bacteroidota bacterium]